MISNHSSKENEIELRSAEVQKILRRPPHWMVQYGSVTTFVIILLLLTGSVFFHYPDVIQGTVVVTTAQPPVWLVAKSGGRISELLCADKQRVNKGSILAVIENPACTKDVLRLESLIQNISSENTVLNNELLLSEGAWSLGEVQTAYSVFIKAFTDYKNFCVHNLIHQEKNSIGTRLHSQTQYVAELYRQIELKQKELQIVKAEYERELQLYQNKVISEFDLEAAEQKWLSKQQEYQQLQTTVATAGIESSDLMSNISKLSVQYRQEYNSLSALLQLAKSELETAISDWKQRYLLISPDKGIVTLNNIWCLNQNIKAGDKVIAIVSSTCRNIIAKVQLPYEGAGKVEPGQAVNIRVAGFPYLEYGVLQGKVSKLSLVPMDKFYTVEVELKNGMTTSTGQHLRFSGESYGTAEIITRNRSLFNRVYAPLIYAFGRSFSFGK